MYDGKTWHIKKIRLREAHNIVNSHPAHATLWYQRKGTLLMLCWWYVHVHIWIVWFDGWNRLLFHICMSCLYWRDGWGNITSSWDPWSLVEDILQITVVHSIIIIELICNYFQCSGVLIELISKLPMAYVFFRCTQYGGEKLCADVILKKISNPSQKCPV